MNAQPPERSCPDSRLQQGRDIERPRSALHSGDFTQQHHTPVNPRHSQGHVDPHTSTSSARTGPVICSPPLRPAPPPPPSASPRVHQTWFATSPPRDYIPPRPDGHAAFPDFFPTSDYRSSPPSLCSSLSSSFVFKHPTSPLVQSESNDDDDDTLRIHAMDLDPCATSNSHRNVPRRQTLHTLHSSHEAPTSAPVPLTAQKIPTTRRGNTFPYYQAHQPRRSLTSVPIASWSSQASVSEPHRTIAPYAISSSSSTRRPSFALESYSSSLSSSSSSPLLQRTSMVGSYEESILRGRMSTTPSKPLDFLAQIGVLGLGGNCKSSLRCPAHVTLPFHAVFYSYSAGGGGAGSSGLGNSSAIGDGPSPYVGMIDLENGLTPAADRDEARHPPRRRSGGRGSVGRRSRAGSITGDGDVDMTGMDKIHDNSTTMSDARDIAKHHRRQRPGGSSSSSGTPKAPPGGCYRIPEKGQLQIIIKNQNKTAVKLFLVPYDLAGMEPGTKTFIRQRVYTGTSSSERSTKTPSSSTVAASGDGAGGNNTAAPAEEKPILRYLIHLHICSPARGRFYLYKSIRVVFASRVPDDKERLRNEITLPEPRFTPYKAVRVMHPPAAAIPHYQQQQHYHQYNNTPSTSLAAEMAFRRSSSGLSFGSQVGFAHQPAPKATSGVEAFSASASRSVCSSSSSAAMSMSDAYALELRQWRAAATKKAAQDRAATVPSKTLDTMEGASSSSASSATAVSSGTTAAGSRSGERAASSVVVPSEGLLTQRLRSLGMGMGLGMRVQSEWRGGGGIEDEMVVSPGWPTSGGDGV